jgi:hypothetical protein
VTDHKQSRAELLRDGALPAVTRAMVTGIKPDGFIFASYNQACRLCHATDIVHIANSRPGWVCACVLACIARAVVCSGCSASRSMAATAGE